MFYAYYNFQKNLFCATLTEEVKTMLELNQLEQLLTFARCGTLSAAAEELHLSQPALSRSMQRLEAELSVPLFTRQKNRIVLNENGELAVEYARKVVEDALDMKEKLVAQERARHTIFVGSCAPAPLWTLLPQISAACPDMTITSEIRNLDRLQKSLEDHTYQLVVLPFAPKDPKLLCRKLGKELLYFTLPPAHPLASRKSLHLADLDGETMLLRPNLGFWGPIVKQAMPRTKFLVQDNEAFNELVKFSILPSFVTDLSLRREGPPPDRVVVPIDDPCVQITYYACCEKKLTKRLKLGL